MNGKQREARNEIKPPAPALSYRLPQQKHRTDTPYSLRKHPKQTQRENLYLHLHKITNHRPSSYTSDHSPIIATLSTAVKNRQPPPRLHTSQTCWETYINIIRDKVDLKPKLKTQGDIVKATEDFISTIQQATQLATPTRAHQYTSTSLPLDIK